MLSTESRFERASELDRDRGEVVDVLEQDLVLKLFAVSRLLFG
jgi:hypothetical protein